MRVRVGACVCVCVFADCVSCKVLYKHQILLLFKIPPLPVVPPCVPTGVLEVLYCSPHSHTDIAYPLLPAEFKLISPNLVF